MKVLKHSFQKCQQRQTQFQLKIKDSDEETISPGNYINEIDDKLSMVNLK